MAEQHSIRLELVDIDALPGHHIEIVSVVIDHLAIRIDYRITPAISDDQTHQILSWHGCAEDDHGNRYVDAGNTFSRSDDGQRIEGSLWFTPSPVRDIARLSVTINPSTETARYAALHFDVDLRDWT